MTYITDMYNAQKTVGSFCGNNLPLTAVKFFEETYDDFSVNLFGSTLIIIGTIARTSTQKTSTSTLTLRKDGQNVSAEIITTSHTRENDTLWNPYLFIDEFMIDITELDDVGNIVKFANRVGNIFDIVSALKNDEKAKEFWRKGQKIYGIKYVKNSAGEYCNLYRAKIAWLALEEYWTLSGES